MSIFWFWYREVRESDGPIEGAERGVLATMATSVAMIVLTGIFYMAIAWQRGVGVFKVAFGLSFIPTVFLLFTAGVTLAMAAALTGVIGGALLKQVLRLQPRAGFALAVFLVLISAVVPIGMIVGRAKSGHGMFDGPRKHGGPYWK